MRALVPIRILIKRKLNKRGGASNDYPDFNKLPEAVRGKMDWCHFVDHFGIGMHYSRDGFGQGEDPHSQVCATCVPADFAAAASAMYPDRVSVLSEEEWAKFYDDDAHSDESEELVSVEVLQALAAKKTLGLALSTSDQNALNPDHAAPGIQRNKRRFWRDAAKEHNCKLCRLEDAAKRMGQGDPPPDLPSCC